MRLIVFAVYLGIGAMLHALFVGPHFDWQSAWTFGWLFGWPIMLLAASWVALIVGLVIAGLIWCGYWWLDVYANWRAKRKRA